MQTDIKATWHVERERIDGRGELEYYDAWRTHDGWEIAKEKFEATAPLPGERVYLGYSDSSQATILRWRGELAIPPYTELLVDVADIHPPCDTLLSSDDGRPAGMVINNRLSTDGRVHIVEVLHAGERTTRRFSVGDYVDVERRGDCCCANE